MGTQCAEAEHSPSGATPTISQISVEGNTLISTPALLAKIPYRIGERFRRHKTPQLIRSIYSLGYFSGIAVDTRRLDNESIALIVRLTEKPKIDRIEYEGNYHLSESEIEKRFHFSEIRSLDHAELEKLVEQLKVLYREKDYHHAEVTGELIPGENNTVIVRFIIQEECKSLVRTVSFVGNTAFSEKTLKTLIFTRQDWLFGFFNKAGSYQPDAIEYDKHVIENYYQSNGYLAAQVTDVAVVFSDDNQSIDVTFTIEEGPLYVVRTVSAPGNDLLTEEQILSAIPIKPGQLYSRELIRQTLEQLRNIWGEFGYINAEVTPSVQPDQEETAVDIIFYTDLRACVRVNTIRILGNYKTREKVIRREILFDEGDTLTKSRMDISQNNVQRLGYFDQTGGVNWKTTRIADDLVDLDLIVKEIRTGRASVNMGFGGIDDIQSPSTSFKVSANIQDTNFMGTGVSYNLNGTYSVQDASVVFNVANPWLFDRPIRGTLDLIHRRTVYTDFKSVLEAPRELLSGGSASLGYASVRANAVFTLDSGIEIIRFENRVVGILDPSQAGLSANYQATLNRTFQSGNLAWVGLTTSQDTRNHPTFPTQGSFWVIANKIGVPSAFGDFSFYKIDLDYRYYTPLIDEYRLVFYFHGHMGFVRPILGGSIPYRELYHIGGIATVRGFFFGQIGPSLLVRADDELSLDSLGAQNTFFLNTELQFPITSDMNLRGVIFYDGGAGWDTPNANLISPLLLRNNAFNYRHSIGFGVRMLYPTPVRIDWGFKLDRNKRIGESASEVHFTALTDF